MGHTIALLSTNTDAIIRTILHGMLTPVSGYLIYLMKKKELTITQQKRLGIAALIIAIAVMGLLVWLVGVPLVRFASQPEHFRTWVNSTASAGVWPIWAW